MISDGNLTTRGRRYGSENVAETSKTKEIGGKSYSCFFELTLIVIGGKWKPIILYQLAREGIMRFSDLRRGIPEATERMLCRQLRELEKDSLIHREVYKQVPSGRQKNEGSQHKL